MPIINPWMILGVLLALVGAFGEGHHLGHVSGVNEQKIADQDAIDKVTIKIEDNKRIASAELANAQQEVIAVQTERDQFKTKLEQEHQTNVETTDRLHNAYAAYGLRFRADASGSGASGTNSEAAQGAAAGNDGSEKVCVVSEATTRSLRAIAYDADKMKDDFVLLYDWAHSGD